MMLLSMILVCSPIFTLGLNLEHALKKLEAEKERLHLLQQRNDFVPPIKYDNKTRSLHEPVAQDSKHKLNTRSAATGVDAVTFYQPDGTAFQKSVEETSLFAHNYLRQQHQNTPDLTWDAALASDCEDYAKQLVPTGNLVHSTGSYGENLYVSVNTFGAVSTPSHATLSWYEESFLPIGQSTVNEYDYSQNPTDPNVFYASGTGHFTQVIWSGTTHLGCGVATYQYEDSGYTWTRTVVVCRYTPPGNYLGQFDSNVQPLISNDASLNGQVNIADCIPGLGDCKDSVPPQTCTMYQGYGYCFIVADHCSCECNLDGTSK